MDRYWSMGLLVPGHTKKKKMYIYVSLAITVFCFEKLQEDQLLKIANDGASRVHHMSVVVQAKYTEQLKCKCMGKN